MIFEYNVKRFCCEDISLIENYDKAVADTTQTWHCHHRKEDEGYSRKQLIEMGLYYNIPSSELIFIEPKEHRIMHSKGNKYSLGHTPWNKGLKGKQTPWNKSKKLSEDTKRKISDSLKGRTPWNKSKKLSEDTKRKISDSRKGKYVGDKHPSARKVYQIDKNTGEIIKEWSCMKLAEETFGLSKSAICNCCRGKCKTSGGFIWRYADNKKEQD